MNEEKKSPEERRKGVDRREGSYSRLRLKYLLKGERRSVRRDTDPQEVYVDLFGLRDFVAVLIVLILSILDAAFTLYHLSKGAEELNLLMAYALNIGVGYFFIIKYSITAFGVIILCIHKNFRYIREIFIGIITIYSLLIIYHIILLFAF
jgi:hypothetical protein